MRLARWIVVALVASLVLGPAAPGGAVGNCAVFRTWSTGDSLTAGDLNSSFTQAAITNATPPCVDDYSTDLTQMRLNTSPGGVGTESLATSLAGELERLRFVLKSLTGWTQWYATTEHLNLGARNLTTTGAISGGSISFTGTLGVASGGTGAATFTANGVLYGNVANPLQVTAQGAANTVLTANAGAPAFSATPTVTSLTTTGSVTVGSGTAITKVLSATASLDFTALAANSCETLTIPLTGAASGDVVALGVPDALADVDGGTERTTFFGWVSAADVVSVRRCNVTGTGTAEPAAATVRAMVTKF